MDKSNKCGCGCDAEIKGGKCSGCGMSCDKKHASSEQARGGKEQQSSHQQNNQHGYKQSK